MNWSQVVALKQSSYKMGINYKKKSN